MCWVWINTSQALNHACVMTKPKAPTIILSLECLRSPVRGKNLPPIVRFSRLHLVCGLFNPNQCHYMSIILFLNHPIVLLWEFLSAGALEKRRWEAAAWKAGEMCLLFTRHAQRGLLLKGSHSAGLSRVCTAITSTALPTLTVHRSGLTQTKGPTKAGGNAGKAFDTHAG